MTVHFVSGNAYCGRYCTTLPAYLTFAVSPFAEILARESKRYCVRARSSSQRLDSSRNNLVVVRQERVERSVEDEELTFDSRGESNRGLMINAS